MACAVTWAGVIVCALSPPTVSDGLVEAPAVHPTYRVPSAADRSVSSYAVDTALRTIEERSLVPIGEIRREGMTVAALKALLTRHDRYADYLEPAALARFRELSGSAYRGLGMELERTPQALDGFVLYPDPDGPAHRDGVRVGDRLVAVEGVDVRSATPMDVAMRLAQARASGVALDIVRSGATIRQVKVRPGAINPRGLSVESHADLTIVALRTFVPGTRTDLGYLLTQDEFGSALVIDLRGNPGGDLNAAIDSAMLFTGAYDTVVRIVGRSGAQVYATVNPAKERPRVPVVLWQDSHTASAAEVFIGALTDNGLAASIGTRSYGKGTRQEVIELPDGGALVLTTGRLETPSGHRFDGEGLEPRFALSAAHAERADYLRATRKWLASLRAAGRRR